MVVHLSNMSQWRAHLSRHHPRVRKSKYFFLIVVVYKEYSFLYVFLMAISLPPARETFRPRSQCHYSTDGGCFNFLLKALLGKSLLCSFVNKSARGF